MDDRTVRFARLVAAVLALGDATFAMLLARRHPLADDLFGESSGSWRHWGVGVLWSYTGVQAVAAAQPNRDRLAAVALLRGALVPAHVSRYAIERTKWPLAVGLCVMNTSVSVLAWRASHRR